MYQVDIAMEACLARQCLVLGMHLLGDKAVRAEYLCDAEVPVSVGKELRRNMRMAAIPRAGVHEFAFEDAPVAVEVVRTGDSETVRIAAPNRAVADRFLDAAIAYCGQMTVRPGCSDTTRRYLYDNGYWDRLGDAPRRRLDSVFLTPEADSLVRDVVQFMTVSASREKHLKFGVPWKMNVLLHGPSGTGKTSLIEAVAGAMGSDVFVVQFTTKLRDHDLALALRRVADHPFPVIVMEDVDCIFSDRKAYDTTRNAVTMSGFLNALDGMSRPEGSVVFMTTNDASCLDKAITRSGRVDRWLFMGLAKACQTKNMTSFFFPDQNVDDFVRAVEGLKFTTADLHQYLFRCDRPALTDFLEHMKTADCRGGYAADNHLYM